MKNRLKVAMLLMLFCGQAFAQSTETRKKEFNLGSAGLALEGYDPVAYFTDHKAVEGKKQYSAIFNGVLYRFASQQHKDEFAKTPSAYEPQYGGWCAYAMGEKGEKVEVDPETFKIVRGKLYLFYNKYFNNTLKSWNKDEANLNARADQNWAKIIP